jgi:hypothetical protein
LTPGTAFAAAASKLATLPPNTGQRSATAYSMPGSRTSIPNVARPFAFGGASRRFVGLPMIVNCAGSFSATLAGGAIFPAASASEP